MTDVALGGHRATKKEPLASFLFLLGSHTHADAGELARFHFLHIFRWVNNGGESWHETHLLGALLSSPDLSYPNTSHPWIQMLKCSGLTLLTLRQMVQWSLLELRERPPSEVSGLAYSGFWRTEKLLRAPFSWFWSGLLCWPDIIMSPTSKLAFHRLVLFLLRFAIGVVRIMVILPSLMLTLSCWL